MHKTFSQTKLSKLFCHQVKLLTNLSTLTFWLRSSLYSDVAMSPCPRSVETPHIWWVGVRLEKVHQLHRARHVGRGDLGQSRHS